VLDAYVAPNARRAVVLIHGGGFHSGSKESLDPTALRFAQSGWTAFSISYRLVPPAPWYAAKEDVLAAVRWVRAHSAEFGFDPARLAVFGTSAGGNLSRGSRRRSGGGGASSLPQRRGPGRWTLGRSRRSGTGRSGTRRRPTSRLTIRRASPARTRRSSAAPTFASSSRAGPATAASRRRRRFASPASLRTLRLPYRLELLRDKRSEWERQLVDGLLWAEAPPRP
jgi:hypothetical protein